MISTRKRKHWKQHIESWQVSDMHQSEYCRRHNLSYHRFIYWKKRFIETETGTKFVPLNLGPFAGKRPLQSGCPLRLVFANRFTIEVNPGVKPTAACNRPAGWTFSADSNSTAVRFLLESLCLFLDGLLLSGQMTSGIM